MKCSIAFEELSAWLAGDLDASRQRHLSEHLDTCDRCRARLGQLHRLDGGLGQLPRHEPSPGALLALRRRLNGHLRPAALPEIMTLPEVAQYLRIGPEQLAEVADELPAFELAGQVRVRRESLEQWVQQREQNYTAGRGPWRPRLVDTA